MKKKLSLWDDSDDDDDDGADVLETITTTTTTATTTTATTTTTTAPTPPSSSAPGSADADADDASYDSEMDDEMLANSDFEAQANDVLSTILHPTSAQDFFKDYFEKKVRRDACRRRKGGVVNDYYSRHLQQPLHIARNLKAASLPLLSKTEIETYINRHSLQYGVDVNVTNVVSGVRRTLDVKGEVAQSDDVWSNFSSGCSVRLLCPQKYSDEVWETLSVLEVRQCETRGAQYQYFWT